MAIPTQSRLPGKTQIRKAGLLAFVFVMYSYTTAVLFSDYLSFFFPQISGWKHYLVSVALVAVVAYVNVRGIQMAGVATLGSDRFALRWGPVAILLGPVMYLFMRSMRARYERKLQLTQSRNL